jgi:hypothetical protein
MQHAVAQQSNLSPTSSLRIPGFQVSCCRARRELSTVSQSASAFLFPFLLLSVYCLFFCFELWTRYVLDLDPFISLNRIYVTVIVILVTKAHAISHIPDEESDAQFD